MFCKLIAFNARYIHSCLALFYVRTLLEDNLPGCRPEVMQFTINDPYYPTLRTIGSGEPEALFFSVYIWNSIYIQRLVTDLVKLLPHTPVILGGPQAEPLTRVLPSRVLSQCTVIAGEAEGIDSSFFADLAESRLQRKYDCAKAPAFQSPYRLKDFSEHLKNRHIYYESSRGCPFGCTYCLSARDKGVRHLPVSLVFEEIRNILEANPKVIRFVDRTFNDLPDRALDIWRFLAEQPGETLFHFEMAPDRFTAEMFRFLEQAESGRFQFEVGVQSTNPETLAAINRKCDLDKAATNIRRLVSLDTIHIHLDLILGLPYETKESFARSFAEVFKFGPHYIQMGLLKVLPDTPISKSRDEYGLVVCENPPYEILSNRWLEQREMAELFWFGECVEAFYNNRFFRSLWTYLRKRNEDIFAFFKALLQCCREKDFFNLAHTQELMSSILAEFTEHRSDRELLRELLVFDWLHCGHRFLPEHLEKEPLAHYKKMLWAKMGQSHAGLYDYSSRDEFFKQGIFAQFSGNLLKETGLSMDGESAHVCFRSAREPSVFQHSRILVIPGFCKE